MNFFSRVLSEASKWFNRIFCGAILAFVLAACVSYSNPFDGSRSRTVYIEGSETDAVSSAYSSILRDAGYRIVDDARDAEYFARFYHEQRTNWCGGNRRVYVRARMTIGDLDMSSTEECAYDNIAAYLQLRDALEDDRATYLRRLREL